MNQRSNRGNRPENKIQYKSNKVSKSNISPKNNIKSIRNPINSPRNNINPQNEKIISHSIKRVYDREGNSIIRTEIMREVDLEDENNINSKSKINTRPIMPYGINNTYSEENPEILYDENYEIISPRDYNTQFKNKNLKRIDIQSYGTGNLDKKISPNNKVKNLKIGGISPMMLFNTPESEYDIQRSYRLGRNNNEIINQNTNTSQQIEMNQKRYTDYNMENPYDFGNHSPENDFNTPDRCNNYDIKYFRNIPVEKIKEKKPFNQEKINIRNNQFEPSLEFDNNMDNIQGRYIHIPEGEDELFEMVDYMATLIQSNVRGFLVRRKVLRFITLAIYYQSFCDKIQDILASHVKTEILEFLKNYRKNYENKFEKDKNETNLINISNSNNKGNDNYKNKININNSDYNQNIININDNKYNYRLTEKYESTEYSKYKHSPKRNLRKEYSETDLTNKISHLNKLRKESSYQNSFNRYNKLKKSKYSRSPSNRIFHCFIHSPCSKRSPHQRYYQEISSKTVNIKNMGDNQLNTSRACHKCDETRRIKKQEKFYITTKKERNEEEKEEYMKKYEINKVYEIKERQEKEKEEKNKYNQLSYNNIKDNNKVFTMRKTLERDNYLSINIIKLQGKDDKNKSLSTRDIFIKKEKNPNRISKITSINYKSNKRQKTEKEIEEEINRRVKITLIEKEKIEKERKKQEEEKEAIKKSKEIEKEKEKKAKEEFNKRERERKEKERKEKYEKERKEKEEKIRKEREEKYIKEKEERKKREEQKRIELEKQRKIKEEQMIKEKEKNKISTNISKSETEQITTTKRIVTNVTKYTRSNNLDEANKTNIQTIKLNEEKKINMSDYILKKDCQKNLEEMKLKLEKEFQKKIEIERNKSLEEKRRYEERIEIINKKEIEKIKEQQKRKELEIKKELDKEKEKHKKSENEIQKKIEKEIKQNIQQEFEKQQKILKQKELEEKNKKLKQIKINKVFEYNLKGQQDKSQNKNAYDSNSKIKTKISEKDRQQAMKLLKKYIVSRGNYLIKLKKYFYDWRLKTKNLEINEEVKILQKYCRNIIEKCKLKRVKNSWIKLSKKIFYKKRIQILKLLPNMNSRKKKIYELLRITKLTRIFSRRRFIHYIILIWYIYYKSIHKKRNNMKFLYENLLRTYMSLANDIFGNNQFENPSVQDAMYEVLNSNKFITMRQDDVPLAKKHYEEMRKQKLLEIKNRINYQKNNVKIEVEEKKMKNIYFSKEKAKTEENEGTIEDKKNEELLNKYKQYKSMNRDLKLQKKNRYINSFEKEDNNNVNENNKYDINKNTKEGNYLYNKTEINKIYSKPLESKYEIKDNKYIKDKAMTPINLNNKIYSEDSNNYGYKKTYIKEKTNQENNNRHTPSYSYKKAEIVKNAKEESKPNNNYINNNKVVSSYYSNKSEDKNKTISVAEENNRDKMYDKKYVNNIVIKTSSSSEKDKNKINMTKSYKK